MDHRMTLKPTASKICLQNELYSANLISLLPNYMTFTLLRITNKRQLFIQICQWNSTSSMNTGIQLEKYDKQPAQSFLRFDYIRHKKK